ncbi:hypothetical protein I4F81_003764 [Pyropia yezoensis]|uniref:Uncharacterized protein n=1 Tax=Pyropia yezoensis TaxID=2788 RepID=A0ACC3BT84_PYRYE|nr:hypothetical protein I4F81_003764 [Neopyropia yezoensis]
MPPAGCFVRRRPPAGPGRPFRHPGRPHGHARCREGGGSTYTGYPLSKGVRQSRSSAGGDTPNKGVACPAASEPPLSSRRRRPRRRSDRDPHPPHHPPAMLHPSDTPRLGRTPTPKGAALRQTRLGPH